MYHVWVVDRCVPGVLVGKPEGESPLRSGRIILKWIERNPKLMNLKLTVRSEVSKACLGPH